STGAPQLRPRGEAPARGPQALGPGPPRPLPHARPGRDRDRPRHHLDRRGPLRRHPHECPRRGRLGSRQAPPPDRPGAGRAQLLRPYLPLTGRGPVRARPTRPRLRALLAVVVAAVALAVAAQETGAVGALERDSLALRFDLREA